MHNVWFTSDHHFSHANVLKFENRPYRTVEEMNDFLIDAWNDHVKEDDIVYHMGDFVFGGYEKCYDIIHQLNGKIHWILGNHDNPKVADRLKEEGHIAEVYEVGHKLTIGRNELWLTHFPLEIGIRPRKWSICGHIHSIPSKYINQLNVGIDSPLLSSEKFGKPLHINDLFDIMNERKAEIERMFLNLRG